MSGIHKRPLPESIKEEIAERFQKLFDELHANDPDGKVRLAATRLAVEIVSEFLEEE